MADKVAYRKLVRDASGKLIVQYIDAATGQVVTDPTGYSFTSAGNDASPITPTTPDATPAPAPAPTYDATGQNSASSMDWGDWSTTHSQGTGDIVGDFKTAFGNLKTTVDNAKHAIVNAPMTIVQGIINHEALKAVPAATEKVNQVATDAGKTAANIANGIFGGNVDFGKIASDLTKGGTPSAPTTQTASAPSAGATEVARNVLFDPSEIGIRKDPVSPKVTTGFAAVLYSVDPTLTARINSGGQEPLGSANAKPGVNRTNSSTTNHDVGADGTSRAMDVQVFDKNGKQLTPANSPAVFSQIAKYATAYGFTQIGMGGDIVHLGESEKDTGLRTWGYDNAGNYKGIGLPSVIATGVQQGLDLKKSGQAETLFNTALAAVTNGQNLPPTQATAATAFNGAKATATGISTAGVSKWVVDAMNSLKPTTAAPTVPTPQGIGAATPVATSALPVDPKLQAAATARVLAATTPVVPQVATTAAQAFKPVQQPATQQQPAFLTPPTQTQPVQPKAAPSSIASTPQASPSAALDPVKLAYLDTINKAEGSPAPNQLFGYGTVDSLTTHPNTKVYYDNGKNFSTAAGSYQINAPTWTEYAAKTGVKDFSEQSQQTVAWKIANDNYTNTTNGRDLYTDLQNGNLQSAFVNNSNRWASLPGGKQTTTDLSTLLSDFNVNLQNRSNQSVVDGSFNAINNIGTGSVTPAQLSAFATKPASSSTNSSKVYDPAGNGANVAMNDVAAFQSPNATTYNPTGNTSNSNSNADSVGNGSSVTMNDVSSFATKPASSSSSNNGSNSASNYWSTSPIPSSSVSPGVASWLGGGSSSSGSSSPGTPVTGNFSGATASASGSNGGFFASKPSTTPVSSGVSSWLSGN